MTSTPASRATPALEREAQLLEIGKQCYEATCGLIDFLPFKCQHCKQSFCQEHFKVEAHRCPNYDESKHDRVAPNCPLCNTPVAIPPGQDPNVRMDTHLTTECSVMTGRAKAKSSPVCAKGNCKKVLFAPIKCTQCKEQFCPSHRFPADHACVAPAPTQGVNTSRTAGSRLLNEFSSTKVNNKASAATSAIKKSVSSASASVSKSIANAKASAPPMSNANSSGTNSLVRSPGNNPFSKVDSAISSFLLSSNVTNSTSPINERDELTKPEPVISTLSFKRKSFVPPPLFSCA